MNEPRILQRYFAVADSLMIIRTNGSGGEGDKFRKWLFPIWGPMMVLGLVVAMLLIWSDMERIVKEGG